jgi:flagellar FliL protein
MTTTEERVVSITANAGAAAATAGAPAAEPKKSKKKLLIIAVLVLALGGAGAWFFVLKPKPAAGAEKKPELGEVIPVDPININLAGGHYLKLSFSLQLKKGVKEAPDPSKALAIAIDQFSGQSMERLGTPAERRKQVSAFTKAVEEAYPEAVIDLYPTTLVMQ